VTLLAHSELDAARHVGDPPADELIAALGPNIWAVNALLRHTHRNDSPLPDSLPPAVTRFCRDEFVLPAWFDAERVNRAQTWASRHLFQLTTALFCASLPTAYAAARGARVLAATGRMRAAALDQRVNETAQFVLDVVAQGSFSGQGSALRSILKVRLMHAAVRAQLRGRAEFHEETPINQEDLLGTLGTFSVLVLRSLQLLGVRATEREAEDYYQLWRVVAVLLGVRERLLPANLWSARELSSRIAARHLQGSEHGRELMAALLTRMEQHVRVKQAPRYLVRYLAGDAVAEHLGLPGDPAFQAKLAFLRLLPSVPRAAEPIAERLSALIGAPLLRSVVLKKLEGAAAGFAMPVQTGAGE
jgi:hypothetical protein